MTPNFDRHSKLAFIIACATLVISGVGFHGAVKALNVYLQKYPVELRQPLSVIPTTLGEWKALGPDITFDEAMLLELGTDKYLNRSYYKGDGMDRHVLKLHLAYYTGMIDAIPHVPDRCMVAGGGLDIKVLPVNLPLTLDTTRWRPDPEQLTNLATGKPYSVGYCKDFMGRGVSVRMPVGNIELRTVEFQSAEHPDWKIFGGYFFIANGGATPTPEGVKSLAFDPSQKYAYYCKVQYVCASKDMTRDEFVQLVADHLNELLPPLMQCLPDWAQVERQDQAKAGAASPSPSSKL